MILRVRVKQNPVSPLRLAEICSSPAACSFHVITFTYITLHTYITFMTITQGTEQSASQTSLGDIVGHLLHFCLRIYFWRCVMLSR